MNSLTTERAPAAGPVNVKRVLCADTDCFSAIGGGQTVYLNLARHYPEYQFHYPSQRATDACAVPNAVPIAKQTALEVQAFGQVAHSHPRWHRYDFEDFVNAVNLARSVRGMAFDVVDVPDYNTSGRYLRFAFEQEGVSVGRFVQSLHGRVSETYLLEWFKIGARPNAYDHARRRAEDLSLASADVRYGLSRAYLRQLGETCPLAYQEIDPLLCVSIPKPSDLPTFPHDVEPRPVFVGRLERQKGVDLFVQMLWDLGPRTAARAMIVGSEVKLGGVSAQAKLKEQLRARGLTLEYFERLDRDELASRVFRAPSVVVLPTRRDTFNLVALEAVLHGCPTMLGGAAGAVGYLKERFPGVPLRVFEETDWPLGADQLRGLLSRFHDVREQTLAAVASAGAAPDRSGLPRAYESPADWSRDARRTCRREFESLSRLSTMLARAGGSAPASPGPPPGTRAGHQHASDSLQSLDHEAGVLEFVERVQSATDIPEETAEALTEKRDALRLLLRRSPFLLRTLLFTELAEVEDRLGNRAVAAAYRARVLRWSGRDRRGVRADVVDYLAAEGLAEEAHALKLSGSGGAVSESDDGVYRYLKERFDRFRRNDTDNRWEPQFDRHRAEGYRASVIVSNYQVEPDRFARFLRLLARAGMMRRGEAEVVVVDSGSAQAQWELNRDDVVSSGVDVTFVRTAARETIQCAWNRGLALARGEYVTFLGTDEAIRPDALDRLAGELDQDRQVDWVIGDSYVAGVTSSGVPLVDKMAYLREGMSRASMLFDCTYLNFVGGLYRRSLHDRCGYYDGSFRGAGDTEFKCRLHPHLRVRHVPETLGVYLDYPAERTTNSARIELEDSRAWYLFRTPGGIRYLFDDAPLEELERAFWSALSNRRAYTRGPESDVALAHGILEHIRRTWPGAEVLKLEPAVRSLAEALEAIGTCGDWSEAGLHTLVRQWRASEGTLHWLGRLRPEIPMPTDLASDARFFAHSWLWE